MKFFLGEDPDDAYDPDDTAECNQPNKNWHWGYVYLIDSGDHKTFKIGHTRYLIQRLEQLRETPVIMPTKSTLSYLVTAEIETNCAYVEELLHMTFDTRHVNGEWFVLEGDDLIGCIDILAGLTTSPLDFYDTWFEYFCSKAGDIQGWINLYAAKPYLYHTVRDTLPEQLHDDEHLLALYENTDADPRLYGGNNKFLKWQTNHVQ